MSFLRSAWLPLLSFGLGILAHRALGPAVSPLSDTRVEPARSSESGAIANGLVTEADLTPFRGGVEEILAQLEDDRNYSDNAFLLEKCLSSSSPARLAGLAEELVLIPAQQRRAASDLLDRVLRAWGRQDIEGALRWAQQRPKAQLQRVMESLLPALVEKDPPRALGLASQQGALTALPMLRRIYGIWGMNDPKAALASLAQVTSTQLQRDAQFAIYEHWAAKDPVAATESAQKISSQSLRRDVLGKILQSWSVRDAAAAWQFCQGLPEGSINRSSKVHLVTMLSVHDPGQAMAEVDKLNPLDRAEARRRILGSWCILDLPASIAYAATMTQPAERAECFRQLGTYTDLTDASVAQQIFAQFQEPKDRTALVKSYLDAHAFQDASACLKVLQILPPEQREKLIADSQLVHVLAQQEPAEALKFVQNSSNADNQKLWSQLGSGVAQTDPDQAFKLISSLPPDRQRFMLPEYFSAIALRDPNLALAQAEKLPNGDTKSEALRRIIPYMVRNDPDAVYRWAQTATGDVRSEALHSVMSTKAGQDPMNAVTMFNQLLASSEPEDVKVATKAAIYLGGRLVAQAPAMATQWAQSLPPGDVQDRAIQNIAAEWTKTSPVEASAWINQLPKGNARDTATGILVQAIKASDPAGAFTWSLSATNENRRLSMLTSVYKEWVKADPAAAREALTRAPLTDQQRTQFPK